MVINKRAFPLRRALFLTLLVIAGASCASNSPTTQPTADTRSKDALQDPFGYSPFGAASSSGSKAAAPQQPVGRKSGLSEFDRDGFNKDADHLRNP